MINQPQPQFEFGPFRLDTAQHCLLRDGQPWNHAQPDATP